MQIDILLSTYNSERYLDILLDSLLKQTYSNFRILIRDDGSTDKTLQIIYNYTLKYCKKVYLIKSSSENLKPAKSFAELLQHSNADYFMFCDHDDYWLPDKVEITYRKMQEAEKNHPGVSVLVFTDLVIVNEKLEIIHSSLWKFSRTPPRLSENPYTLAINNPVFGCTVMINKTAKSLVLPIPDLAIMHDWWIALKVAQSGHITYVNKGTIYYRQHELNTIGTSAPNRRYLTDKILNIKRTIHNNTEAFVMLKLAVPDASLLKFLYYKLKITLLKILYKR